MTERPNILDDGEMERAVADFDWSATPLGPVDAWSPALRMMVRFLLANRFPLLLWWGPQYVSIYNDAYRPVLGAKHPWALGRPVSEVWQEIWPTLKPLIDTPFGGGPATWNDDLFLEINRHGFLEETHFTVAYSPVPDDSAPGGIGGVLATVDETTGKVVAERRVLALRDLARSVDARSAEEACAVSARTLAGHAKDIPFALLYLVDPDRKAASLAGTTEVVTGEPTSQVRVPLDSGGEGASMTTWPLVEVMNSEEPQVVTGLGDRLEGQVPSGPWTDPPHTAVVVPIASTRAHVLAGFLVAGISPRLALDDSYRDFLNLVSSQIATSIAKAREHEQELERMQALAEIDRAKTIFFSNVSHEFRTPLTLMLSPLEEALADGSSLSEPSQRERISTAHSNGLRLLKLVNNLLDFARVDAGSVRTSLQSVDVSVLTEDLVSIFRSAFDAAGVELVTEIESVGTLDVDFDMWETTVLNLVSNALKYTLRGTVRVRLERQDHLVRLSVSDTGVGIASEDQVRVFERFFRSSSDAGRSFEGSGIGLALVSQLVQLHGGSIDLDSTPGSGSTFTVTLPASESGSETARDGLRSSSSTRSRAFAADAQRWVDDTATLLPPEDEEVARKSVLVVDDNSDMRRYLHSLFTPEWRVALASTGRQALEAARRNRPDLVLSDVMMPDIDGLNLVDRLRADPTLHDVPVVLLSGQAGAEATVDGLSRGANDYVVKPFTASELQARVRALLDATERSSRANADALAGLRRAEELARLSATLHITRTLRAIVDGSFAWLQSSLGARFAAVSLVERNEEEIRTYYAGSEGSSSLVERELQVPIGEHSDWVRAVRDQVSLSVEGPDVKALEIPELSDALKTGGLGAFAVFPLRHATGAVFAALSVGWEQAIHIDPELMATLQEAAGIVAAAAERGQLADRERAVTQRLEDSLLKIDTRSTGVIVRARHHGSDPGADVGGDWYDAIDLSDGCVAAAVGDVVGHGLAAARTADRLRGALDLAVFERADPTGALTVLDHYAQTVPGARCTTVALAVIDPARQVVSYACAGHPPPLVVSPGGEVAYLEDGRSWPLDVDVLATRAGTGQAPFPPGSLLLLYTDGLVERRRESLEVGLERLARVVADHWDLPLRRLKDAVFAHLVGDRARDDIALVAARSVGASRTLFCDAFAASRDEQGAARRRLQVWLEEAGIASEERNTIVLAIGEAISNAIDHGSDGDESQIVTVELTRRGEQLLASVGDRGRWEAGLQGLVGARGRGYLIMDALADEVDVAPGQGGTVVTLRFDGQAGKAL